MKTDTYTHAMLTICAMSLLVVAVLAVARVSGNDRSVQRVMICNSTGKSCAAVVVPGSGFGTPVLGVGTPN